MIQMISRLYRITTTLLKGTDLAGDKKKAWQFPHQANEKMDVKMNMRAYRNSSHST